MPKLLERATPVMRRATRLQQHRRGRAVGKEREEPRTAQSMLGIDPTGRVRNGDLKDRFCDVNGDGRMLYLDSSFAMASGAVSSLPR